MEWINGIGKETYIASYAKGSLFFNTSCLLTAAILRYRLSGKLWWEREWDGLSPLPTTFQVFFSIDGEDYDDHVITIHDSRVYDSFYGRHAFKMYDFNRTNEIGETIERFAKENDVEYSSYRIVLAW